MMSPFKNVTKPNYMDTNRVEVLHAKTSYEIDKVKITDQGYEKVGTEVIRFVTGNPTNLTIPRKEGIRVDSLIKILLVNAAERTVGDISAVSEEDIRAVKNFIVKRASNKEEQTKKD